MVDINLEEYYKERFKMFEGQGWKDLMTDIGNMKKQTNQLYLYSNEKEFFKGKGELSIIDWLLSLEDVSYKVYEDLTNASIQLHL